MHYQIFIQNYEGDYSPVGGDMWLADAQPLLIFQTEAEAQSALNKMLANYDDFAAPEYWKIERIES